jgi:hypothetical protein
MFDQRFEQLNFNLQRLQTNYIVVNNCTMMNQPTYISATKGAQRVLFYFQLDIGQAIRPIVSAFPPMFARRGR